MAYTRQDLITLVLQNVGVLAAGQEASIEDRATVDLRIDSKLAELAKREIFTGLNADALDAAVILHVADVIASACRVPFGITGNKSEVLTSAAVEAEASLKLLSRQFSATAATDAFDVVRHVLEVLGVVTAGQDPSAQDRGVVTARVSPMLADLRSREIIAFTDLASADAAHRRHLATILTASCAPAFGVAGAALMPFIEAAAAAEQQLRALARQFDNATGTNGVFDLVQSTLEALGVVEAGQTATPKDRAVVSARVVPMLADLRQREIISLPSTAAADASTQLHLAAILALACAVPFKIVGEALLPFQAAAAQAEAALRIIGRQLDGGVATNGTFDVVQAVLENLGVVMAGYTGSAKDRAVVSARIAPTLADLRLREIANIASIEAADPGVLIHLSVILTSACSQAFGKDANARTLQAAEATKAEAALKALARQLDQGSAVSGQFDPVQVVLEHLGIVSAGQTASAADRAVIDARVQPKLLELYGRDICGVTDLSQLSPELQGAFARILAADCALSFSEVTPQRVVLLQSAVAEAERILRYQSFVYDARPPLRMEPFWGRRRGPQMVAPRAPAQPVPPPPGQITLIFDGGEV